MADSLNMTQITSDKLQRQLSLRIRNGVTSPILILGKAGIGKTEQITQLAKDEGIGYKEIRLLLYDAAELKGIPYADKETQTTKIFPQDIFPTAERDGERGILVLDEVTSCQAQLRTAVFQLLDAKRSLGSYKLPDGWMIVCLGNGPEDGGNFQGVEGAFLSRCACYHMEPNYEHWIEWARKHGVNQSVIAFIEANPSKIHTLTREKWEETDGACLFACPRSWTLASKMLNIYENDAQVQGMKPDEKYELVNDLIAGYVGDDIAILFTELYKLNTKMINVNDVLSGKKPDIDPTMDRSLIYLTIESIIAHLGQKLQKYDRAVEAEPEDIMSLLNVIEWTLDIEKKGQAARDLAANTIIGFKAFQVWVDLLIDYESEQFLRTLKIGNDAALKSRLVNDFNEVMNFQIKNGLQFGN